jgi:hypothetical protein
VAGNVSTGHPAGGPEALFFGLQWQRNTALSLENVTSAQQLDSFYRQRPESLKKAAIAPVFALPLPMATGVSSPLMRVLLRTGRSQPGYLGFLYARVTGDLYRLDVDRTE